MRDLRRVAALVGVLTLLPGAAAAERTLSDDPGGWGWPPPAPTMTGEVHVIVDDRRPPTRNGHRYVGSYTEINKMASLFAGFPIPDKEAWVLPNETVVGLISKSVRYRLHAHGIWAVEADEDAWGDRLFVEIREFWCNAPFTPAERCSFEVRLSYQPLSRDTPLWRAQFSGPGTGSDPWGMMLEDLSSELDLALAEDARLRDELTSASPRGGPTGESMLTGGRLVSHKVPGDAATLDLLFPGVRGGLCAFRDGVMEPFEFLPDELLYDVPQRPGGPAGANWIFALRSDGTLLSAPVAGETAGGAAIVARSRVELLPEAAFEAVWTGPLPADEEVCGEPEEELEFSLGPFASGLPVEGLTDLRVGIPVLAFGQAAVEVEVAVAGDYNDAELWLWINPPGGGWDRVAMTPSEDGGFEAEAHVEAETEGRTTLYVYVSGTVWSDRRRRVFAGTRLVPLKVTSEERLDLD